MDQGPERLLARGPNADQVIIFTTHNCNRKQMRPCLLIELTATSASGTTLSKLRHLTFILPVPFYPEEAAVRSMESGPLLPTVLRAVGNYGGYLFFDRLGQVYLLRDAAIIPVEHAWQPPDFRRACITQRMVVFKFGGIPTGDERACPLGALTRYEYFQKLFEGWQEGSSGEVDVSDSSPEVFDHMLGYMFTGTITDRLQLSSFSKLAALANKYLMHDLLSLAVFHIIGILVDGDGMREMDVIALAELLAFSELAQSSCPTLKGKLISSILEFRNEVVKDQFFLKEVAISTPSALAELSAPLHREWDDFHMMRKRRKKENYHACSNSEKHSSSWGKLDGDGCGICGSIEVLRSGSGGGS